MSPSPIARMLALIAALAALAPATAAAHDDREPNPLVIGHRGASGYLPEHTLPGYALAIKIGRRLHRARSRGHQGRLPDRAPRAEHRCHHERGQHPEFTTRRTTKMVDGFPVTDWFASDFTLREIKTLRAIQPNTARPDEFDGLYRIPTLAQVIRLAQRWSKRTGRRIGVYPETKHPTFHKDEGLALEGRLVHILDHFGLDRRRSPVFIQSFEQSNLKRLNRMTKVRLVQLVDANDVKPDGTLDYTAPFDRPYDWTVSGNPRLLERTFGFFATKEGLDEVARYADGIGPWKPYVNSWQTSSTGVRTLIAPSDLVEWAHDRGLVVHPYTFRNEQNQLLSDFGGNPVEEYLHYYRLGVDGVFSDFPDTAFTSRELFRLETGGSEDEEP